MIISPMIIKLGGSPSRREEPAGCMQTISSMVFLLIVIVIATTIIVVIIDTMKMR